MAIPTILYGTAWKKEQTALLIQQALESGFRAIDTAAQPKHYREDLVGDGIRAVLRGGKVTRKELFIQTKFTWPSGQDLNSMPYSAALPIPEQVQTSVSSSLYNLRPSDADSSVSESYVDCLLLHSPPQTYDQLLQAWTALESFVPHKIHRLGISNVSLPVLQFLFDSPDVKIKPAMIQNRFYPKTAFNAPLRHYCRAKGVLYQGFWVLTANPELLASSVVRDLAERLEVDVQVALYGLVLELGGMAVLNGTTSQERMTGDLEGLKDMARWRDDNKDDWKLFLGKFKELIHESQ